MCSLLLLARPTTGTRRNRACSTCSNPLQSSHRHRQALLAAALPWMHTTSARLGCWLVRLGQSFFRACEYTRPNKKYDAAKKQNKITQDRDERRALYTLTPRFRLLHVPCTVYPVPCRFCSVGCKEYTHVRKRRTNPSALASTKAVRSSYARQRLIFDPFEGCSGREGTLASRRLRAPLPSFEGPITNGADAERLQWPPNHACRRQHTPQ